MRYVVCVKRPGGHYARRQETLQESPSLVEYKEKVRTTTSLLTRFGDVWNISTVPDNDHAPMRVVYEHKG